MTDETGKHLIQWQKCPEAVESMASGHAAEGGRAPRSSRTLAGVPSFWFASVAVLRRNTWYCHRGRLAIGRTIAPRTSLRYSMTWCRRARPVTSHTAAQLIIALSQPAERAIPSSANARRNLPVHVLSHSVPSHHGMDGKRHTQPLTTSNPSR